MNFIEKIQSQPLSTRKAIVWAVAIIIALAFSFWRISAFRGAIQKIGENDVSPEYEETVSFIRSSLDDFREIAEKVKEVQNSVEEVGFQGSVDFLLLQDYIRRTSPDPDEDIKRALEDKDFYDLILERAKGNASN